MKWIRYIFCIGFGILVTNGYAAQFNACQRSRNHTISQKLDGWSTAQGIDNQLQATAYVDLLFLFSEALKGKKYLISCAVERFLSQEGLLGENNGLHPAVFEYMLGKIRYLKLQ